MPRFAALMDVVLSDFDVVQPDLLFITNNRASIITEKNIQGPPDIVVEILSEFSRKTGLMIKRKLYERSRIFKYWILDPELESIKINRVSGQGYSGIAELSVEAKDALTSALFPDWQLPVSQIFA